VTIHNDEQRAPEAPPEAAGEIYDEATMGVLKGPDGIRKRPGMYIGDVDDGTALHLLVWEAVDNAIDEFFANECTRVDVTIHADGSIRVADNGRGIPTGIHPTEGVSTAQVMLTNLRYSRKFNNNNNNSYKVSAGTNGCGIKAVNAVSEWLKLEIWREGKVWEQEYRQGVPQAPIAAVGETDKHGTALTFKPDATIFTMTEFSYDILENRLRQLSYLNAGLELSLTDERRAGETVNFLQPAGIKEYVRYLNTAKVTMHSEPIYFRDEVPQEKGRAVVVDVALQWNDSIYESTLAFTNNIKNKDGGTHAAGFHTAITRTLNAYGTKHKLLKALKGATLQGEDVREGITAVIALKHPSPRYSSSQGPVKLVSPEVVGMVASVINNKLSIFLEQNPQVGKKVIEKCVLVAKAREANTNSGSAVGALGVPPRRTKRGKRFAENGVSSARRG
jgi:DNA gyrase subunit B